MDKVPKILTSKDLAYIEDMLNWNFNTIKKINCYIDIIDDDEINCLLTKISKTYKDHFNLLLNLLGEKYENM